MSVMLVEFLSGLKDVPKETWSLIGTGLGITLLGAADAFVKRKADNDKKRRESEATTPVLNAAPSGSGVMYVTDGQTERDILTEVRGLRADANRREERDEHRREQEKMERLENDKENLSEQLSEAKRMLVRLREGQVQTHDNQGTILDKTSATEQRLTAAEEQMRVLMEKLGGIDWSKLVDNLRVH